MKVKVKCKEIDPFVYCICFCDQCATLMVRLRQKGILVFLEFFYSPLTNFKKILSCRERNGIKYTFYLKSDSMFDLVYISFFGWLMAGLCQSTEFASNLMWWTLWFFMFATHQSEYTLSTMSFGNRKFYKQFNSWKRWFRHGIFV